MAHVKTAISIEESLFREVDQLADEMNTSRSRLIEMAVSEFVHRQKSKKLLEEINSAYDDTPDAMEGELRRAMKAKHRQLLESEKW